MRAIILPLTAGGLVLAAGCVVEPNGRVAFQPLVVPDDYTWDGYEYVGLVGGQYFYLGPGHFWLAMEPFRLERFHGWERGHGDWRNHAIRNDRYRHDRNGHLQPRRDVRAGKDRKDEH
jgi:hypothetical protein